MNETINLMNAHTSVRRFTEEQISDKELRAIIDAEEKTKPLSDRELTERLTAEGVQICRRTVAKYREAMGIAGASGRKRYDAEK